MFDNFSNFSFKKFPIWCFKIDLSNLCALQCLQFYKRRCFKVPGPTALYIVHIQYIPCIQIENWFRTVLYCKIKLIISIEIVIRNLRTQLNLPASRWKDILSSNAPERKTKKNCETNAAAFSMPDWLVLIL